MNIELIIVDLLKSIILKEFKSVFIPQVFKNKNSVRGDYFTQVPLVLEKKLNIKPLQIANILSKNLQQNPLFLKVSVTENGFINFFINKNYIVKSVLKNANTKKVLAVNKSTKLQKIIVEHTSVNPNKAMHVGHIKNAVLGSTIVNILKAQGRYVEVHNYIDDTGLQVADTTNAVLNLNVKKPKNQSFEDYAWDIYALINKEYEANNVKLLKTRKQLIKKIESGQGIEYQKSVEIVDLIVKSHLALMAKMNIFYDLLVYESDVINFGFWDEAFLLLKKSPNFYLQTKGKQKGCYVLKSTKPDIEDKIFIRKNGTKVYTAKDTAYHLWKFGKLKNTFLYKDYIFNSVKTDKNGKKNTKFGNANIVITLTDERQSYALNAVRDALTTTGFKNEAENMYHVAYGVVSLSKNTAEKLGVDTSSNKPSYSMSGRQGLGVKVTDLLFLLQQKIKQIQAENKIIVSDTDVLNIAVCAIKHYLLKYNPASPIVFDYESALQINGNTGPYLLYSFVRANNILNKANKYKNNYDKAELTVFEEKLVLQIAEWESVLNNIDFTFNTSKIVDYAFNLSKAFHAFYENDNVLNADINTRNFRLTLVLAYKNTLQKVLDVMGIKTVSSM